MMPDGTHLLLVYSAYVVAAASPGPSTMRIMATAMHRGRRAGLTLAAGVVTGSVFWGMMAATGVSAVLAQHAGLLTALKAFGGLYLLYLAFKAGRSAARRDDGPPPREDERGAFSLASLYRQGLLMHLANPKSVLGWIALVTLGLGPDATVETAFAVLAGCAALSVAIFGGYALVFSTAPAVRAYRRARRWIEGVLAASFAFAGMKLLLSRN